MKCPKYGECYDAEWCQQGGPCDVARKAAESNGASLSNQRKCHRNTVVPSTDGMVTGMSKIIATVLLTLGLLASSSAAALACGDTPGFCPNPPNNSSHYDPPLRQYHTHNSGIKYE